MGRMGENIYKRKDGRWEGRYMKGRKENGAIHYGYVYGKTRRSVQKILLPLKYEYSLICHQQGSYSGSIEIWLNNWLLNEVKSQVKIATFSSYHYKIQRYIIPLLGKCPLNQLNEEKLLGAIKKWQKTLSNGTIRILLMLIKRALQNAVQEGLLQRNICEKIPLPQLEKKKVESLTKEVQRKVEAVAKVDPDGLPTLLALHTGLRIGEIAALSWSDIDFEEQILRIRKTYQRVSMPYEAETSLVLGTTKTKTSLRDVPFSNQVKTWLLRWREKQKKKSKYLFNRKDRPIEPRLLTYHFKKILNQIGDLPIHFHQLRHTFAMRCLEAQGDIVSISALLGHSSAKTTMDVYLNSLMEQRRKIIDQMEKFI